MPNIEIPESVLADWQEIVDVLSRIVGVPAALIMRRTSLDIEVFVSSQSEGNPYQVGDKEELMGSGLYCEEVIKTQSKLLVPDSLSDENWKNNPDVKLNMISYLGFPIRLPDGSPFGTVCVLDNQRNEYSEWIEKLMQQFLKLIESHLELVYMNQRLGAQNERLSDYLMELQALRGLVPICASCKSIRDNQDQWRPIEHYLIKHPVADFSHGICPECAKKLYPDLMDEDG
jgi:GAF domain-containing protein